ncbi:pentapeptide repeat-containing protein [Leptolyngbya sp. FACHB-17]|uniref:pentapeptide repeat-containing protein n=1 Tax=unclassified Leptolyngbya TaxID=2650499 RepID=UPI00168175EE|nr:pentapeptide repeat-containing protein [Leptolyngbya sp. FACHB-17]MBD2078471.1 pentapeptide repeat-containing protein [Leptolyngbya sp. FACHB-17]
MSNTSNDPSSLSKVQKHIVVRLWESTGFRGKTLWDIMQLLIVPTALLVGGYVLNEVAAERDRKNEDLRRKNDQTLADLRYKNDQSLTDLRYKGEVLKNYFEHMTTLLSDEGLAQSKKGSEVRSIANARTLSTLRELDEERKGILLKFLHEAQLIDSSSRAGKGSVLSLRRADLRSADLRFADLQNSSLKTAELSGANLSFSDLRGVDLRSTDLTNANLGYANLKNAKLDAKQLSDTQLRKSYLCETTMPGGTKSNRDCDKFNKDGSLKRRN